MKGLVVINQTPKVPENWDYEVSVARVKPLIYKWKNLTIEIATELWIARSLLSSEGRPWQKLTEPNGSVKTWKDYCQAIGIPKTTANRWLASIFGPYRLARPKPPKIDSQVIYADPPWQFHNAGFAQAAEAEYPTMELKEICDLKDSDGKTIKELIKRKKVVLFLWMPESMLPQGLEVMGAWGFTYRAQFIWVKNRYPGIAFWVKSRHEVLCIGTNEDKLQPSQLYDSVFEAPVSDHSKKPELVYEMIEDMYTGPYIELFARNTRPGWESWGNEVS